MPTPAPLTETQDNWRPRASPGIAAMRAGMLARCREFFAAHSIMEVETPLCQRYTVTDPNIDSFIVQTSDGRRYLQTSPEYQMKRLLAAGYPDIFQLGKVYRAGEIGSRHLSEFTMAEWYRLGFSLQDMMQETIAFVTNALAAQAPSTAAVYLSYRDAFRQALEIDPLAADISTLQELAGADSHLRSSLGHDRDGWLDLLMATKVSKQFQKDRLTAVYHYPSSQAVLARLSTEDPSVAERFELFRGDIELANGFVELADADAQLARFEADQAKRHAAGLDVPDIDPRLIAAMRAGLPDCAGVAVGIDRLMMIYAGADSIGDVNTFTLDAMP